MDAPHSPHCYRFCTVFFSALSQATKNHCRQKEFQIAVIHKNFENIQYIKYGWPCKSIRCIYGVVLILVTSFCDLCTAGY